MKAPVRYLNVKSHPQKLSPSNSISPIAWKKNIFKETILEDKESIENYVEQK